MELGAKKACDMRFRRLLIEAKNKLEDYKNAVVRQLQFILKGTYTSNANALVGRFCSLGCLVKNAGEVMNCIYQQLCWSVLSFSKQVERSVISSHTS